MFGKNKRILAAIQELSARLSRIEAGTVPQTPALASHLEAFATASLEQNSKNLDSMGRFLSVVSDIAVEKAASAMGKRRAKNATRGPKGNYVKKGPACRLCQNGLLGDPSIKEIEIHSGHGSGRSAGPSPQPRDIEYSDRGSFIEANVPEELIQKNHLGQEIIECPDCDPNANGKVIH